MYITISPQKLGGTYSHCSPDYIGYFDKENQGWKKGTDGTIFNSFNTIARSIQMHYKPILNYFNKRSNNTSTESLMPTSKS